ncbi:cyclopropane-fatty-acyl-phospholipid synthase family protein [Allobranchiibius sp. GilTou38]|uniref:SAM-dependent methyltransferase n=1 Tax=Allobranchiibius sp. GilTou38 TaxID=2815210 RepID=UPI001AA10C5E|nr:cyclopropane-fatty-acyl-phospholipid synthase family protein [Allobranchiibius sp. GilTou38]MBO1765642.1 class I SAM-dependent methyltransferase [Allobranchiibius sp. GilTou38]
MTMTIGEVFDELFGTELPLKVTAYDGSSGGNPEAPYAIELRNERALRYMVTAPGELGLVRAYLMGDLELHGVSPGNPYDFLNLFMTDFQVKRPQLTRLPKIAKSLGIKNFQVPPLPDQEQPPQWRRGLEGLRHSRKRDADAIRYHYDVSNEFYELVLGDSMTYTCACYPADDATLDEAQANKYDLVCRKLDLQPGQRLLDVGCGWGGMVRHAVEHYGVTALGVTLSRNQATWADQKIKQMGLDDRAEVRYLDYRDVTESDFDAVSSIGLTEHIGVKNYPAYFSFLYSKLRPGGRLLNHCITRPNTRTPALTRGGFINRYVFPDGELTGVGVITSAMQDQGFEVRHLEDLREHYARTCAAWAHRLEEHWEECVQDAGLPIAKIWGLYLAGSSLGFARNNIQLHQVLGQKIGADGVADYPLRPSYV